MKLNYLLRNSEICKNLHAKQDPALTSPMLDCQELAKEPPLTPFGPNPIPKVQQMIKAPIPNPHKVPTTKPLVPEVKSWFRT